MKARWFGRDLTPPLLRDEVFRRYWGASTVSMFGDQVSSVAVPLTAVLVLHARAYEMGYLTALQWLPSLLFGLHAGAWVDRSGKRRNAMILADLGRAAAFATIPLCFALHVLTLVQMCVVTFVAGSLSVLFTVSDGTLFMSIVDPEEYVDGQSLIYGSRALSFLGGPSVGGLLVQALSGPYAIVADALSFIGSAIQLGAIRPAEPPPARDGDGITIGLRFIAGSPIVRASLTGVAVVNFFNLMFEALYMLYAVRVLGVTAGVLGAVIGAGAVGGILGSVLCKRLTSSLGAGLVYVSGCLVFTVPLALVPLAAAFHGIWVLGLLFAANFCSGFGVMVLDISIAAIFGIVIPAEMRSRVSGAFQAINYGTRPLGALLGGWIGTMLGLRPTLWIAVAGGVAGSLLLLPSPLPQFRMPGLMKSDNRAVRCLRRPVTGRYDGRLCNRAVAMRRRGVRGSVPAGVVPPGDTGWLRARYDGGFCHRARNQPLRGPGAAGGLAGSRGRACCRGQRARLGHRAAGRLPGQRPRCNRRSR